MVFFHWRFFLENMIYKIYCALRSPFRFLQNFNFSIGTCYAQVSTGAEVLVDIKQKKYSYKLVPWS